MASDPWDEDVRGERWEQALEKVLEPQVRWRVLGNEVIHWGGFPSILRSNYGVPGWANSKTFWGSLLVRDIPHCTFVPLIEATLSCEGDRAFSEPDEGGNLPIHLALRQSSDVSVICAVIALTKPHLLSARTSFGNTPREDLVGYRAHLHNADEIRALFDEAIADPVAFKAKHYPTRALRSVADYAAQIAVDPRCLLRREEATGYSLLDRARSNDEGADVVLFLEADRKSVV